MPRTLLVTNDFPPRPGGIQTYLHQLALRLPAGGLVVQAPGWPGAGAFDAAQQFPVVREPDRVLLPSPGLLARAAAIAERERCDTVWFGAAAPLGLLGPALRRRGAARLVASTHGHETGWALLPGARAALRRIAHSADVTTAVSGWSRDRLARALGPGPAPVRLLPGVDADLFRPDPAAGAAVRRRWRLGAAPVVVCVSRLVPRKGQDALVRALPAVRRRVPGAVLLLVGGGPHRAALHRLAARCGVERAVVVTGSVPCDELPAHHAAGDVFAMPCRTRRGGLDVEGLGIVLLEAAATGLPVVAGRSGGAPEAVRPGKTGHVVDGRDVPALARALTALLADPDRAAAMGRAGREWVRRDWRWPDRAARLQQLLAP